MPPPTEPSPWVRRFAPYVEAGGPVLDLACGAGRHTIFFLGRGHPVTAVDRDTAGVRALLPYPGADPPRDGKASALEIIETDLEDGRPYLGDHPLAGRRFAAVVVTDYLHRPRIGDVIGCLSPALGSGGVTTAGGLLLYETFAVGQEVYGRPTRPEFLLQPGELLDVARRQRLRVLAYEELIDESDPPAVRQRICAQRVSEAGSLERPAGPVVPTGQE